MLGTDNKIKLLVIDDSAIVRQTIKLMLKDSPTIEVVGAAINPKFAAHKIQELKPDVLLLDIQMPEIDGLTFLKTLMKQNPIPTIIFSSFAPEGSENALKALEYGAVEVIEKPQLALPEDIENYKTRLVHAIESAALAKVRNFSYFSAKQNFSSTFSTHTTKTKVFEKPLVSNFNIIAIGASTGGPQAIRTIIEKLPINAPPVAIVQHMPPGFTKLFANRLNELSQITVKEAEEGDVLKHGLALVAPGDKHLTLIRKGTDIVAHLDDSQPVNRHKPSVDMLFWSVAKLYHQNAIGIILTGMGADGVKGMLEMRKAGAHTIAQDQETSVVFGMPKVAINRGAAQVVLPIHEIPQYLNKLIAKPQLRP